MQNAEGGGVADVQCGRREIGVIQDVGKRRFEAKMHPLANA
jgi:hypothetical protein